MGCAGSKDEVTKAPEPATTQPDRTAGATEAAVQPVAAPTVTQAPVDKPTADEPMAAKIPVVKATYVAWEAEVIKAFYTSERKVTDLIPTDEQVAVVSKVKYILVVDACDAEGGCISEKVGSGATGLSEQEHVQLWHIKKKKEDGVRYGLAVEDGLFKHPACDLGGLTNLRQKLGEPVVFAGTPVPWGGAEIGDTAETVAKSLLEQWRELTGKELEPNPAPQDITKFIQTVKKAMGPVMLRFHMLPPEHRVVVTPAAVKKATGIYYERVYGGGDDKYAEVWDNPGKNFFCGITEKFVTANLNKDNLEMECVTYA